MGRVCGAGAAGSGGAGAAGCGGAGAAGCGGVGRRRGTVREGRWACRKQVYTKAIKGGVYLSV